MAVMGVVRRLAAATPVPVLVLQGSGGGPAGDAERLRRDPRLDVVDSPRHATVLLVAGALPPELHEPAALVHDALPHPRATVRWGDADDGWGTSLALRPTAGDDDVAAAVLEVHRGLIDGTRDSEPPLMSSTSREPWRGVGPFGHGGSGMTGGVPHGRPLPDRADDLRDGLKLDALSVPVGPFYAPFPVGLMLDVVLQGDLVQEVHVHGNPFLAVSSSPTDVFARAATEPVRVAALEQARVVHHLRAIARTLRLLGLHALAARMVQHTDGPPEALLSAGPGLARLLRRTSVERSLPPCGTLADTTWDGHGFAARAAGSCRDARSADPSYDDLGFTPVCGEGGDVRARWRQRLAEIDQSIALAAAAGTRLHEPGPVVEDPASVTAELLPMLPDLLVGLEWGDAVAVVDSLDLDLRRTAPIDQVAT